MDKGNHQAIVSIGLCIVFTVIGQILMKHGILQIASVKGSTGLLGFLLRVVTNVWVVMGLLSAGLAAVAWTRALARSDLSFAYPFMGLAIVLVLALSGVVFHEHSSPMRWIGVLVVCFGLFVASRG